MRPVLERLANAGVHQGFASAAPALARVHDQPSNRRRIAINAMDNWDLIAPNLVLRGIYDMPRVEQLYEQLPGIYGARIFEGPADGPTWCIGRNGDDYEYLIDLATRDCSTGCREHEAHRFSSQAAGKATPLEIWHSADGELPPDWYTRLCP